MKHFARKIFPLSLMTVALLFSYPNNLYAEEKKEISALDIVLEAENAEKLQELINQGANINIQDDGLTALCIAAKAGEIERVRLFLDNGAKPDLADNENRTPLLWAAHNGHTEVVKALLDKGAKADLADNENRTPLYWAAYNGHTEVVKALLDKGAKPDIANNKGNTPLFSAADKGHAEIAALLISKGANINAVNKNNETPLLQAAYQGHTEVVKALLDKGAKADLADNENGTPLYWAAFKGHTEVVKALLDKGAKADLADNKNSTPLSWAENNGHSEIVALLIRHLVNKGVNVNTTYKWDSTFLHYAASGTSNIDLLHWLIDKGANVNAVDEVNRTPLDCAINTFYITQDSPYKELRQQREKVLAKIHLLYEHSNVEIQQKMKDTVDGLSKYQSKNTANQSLADEMAAKGKSFSPSLIDVQYAEERLEKSRKDVEKLKAAVKLAEELEKQQSK